MEREAKGCPPRNTCRELKGGEGKKKGTKDEEGLKELIWGAMERSSGLKGKTGGSKGGDDVVPSMKKPPMGEKGRLNNCNIRRKNVIETKVVAN